MMDKGATAKEILEKVGKKLVVLDFDVAEQPDEEKAGEKEGS